MAVTNISTFYSPQANPSGHNNAAIKDWGSKISSLFSGAGLIQTSDTGQVNWTTTTFTPLGSTNGGTVIGYEVWRLNDSLQATKPIFFVVEYITSDASATTYQYYIRMTVTSSTNGAGSSNGALTQGNIYVTNSTDVNTNNFGSLNTAWSSGNGSWFNLVLGSVAGTGPGLGTFFFDRTRDSSGAITNEGCAMGWTGATGKVVTATNTVGNASSGFYRVFNHTLLTVGSLGGSALNTSVLLPTIGYDFLSTGTTEGVEAPPFICNQKLVPPILAAVSAITQELPGGVEFDVTLSGASHHYISLGSFANCANRLAGNTAWCLALRYE